MKRSRCRSSWTGGCCAQKVADDMRTVSWPTFWSMGELSPPADLRADIRLNLSLGGRQGGTRLWEVMGSSNCRPEPQLFHLLAERSS